MNWRRSTVTTIDWPPSVATTGDAWRAAIVLRATCSAVVVFGGGTALSYYVDSLWFESLGFADVFWKTLNLQALIFTLFAVVTFAVLYGVVPRAQARASSASSPAADPDQRPAAHAAG